MFWPLRTSLFLLLIATSSIKGLSQNLVVDPENTQISFKVKHLGVLTVEGYFQDFKGWIDLKDQRIENVACVIVVSSIDTQDDSRDKTLRSAPYFDVGNFPQMDFVSTRTYKVDQLTMIEGSLRIKGVQKTIELQCKAGINEQNESVLKMETEISREDFQLEFGSMDALVGDKVKIEITIRR